MKEGKLSQLLKQAEAKAGDPEEICVIVRMEREAPARAGMTKLRHEGEEALVDQEHSCVKQSIVSGKCENKTLNTRNPTVSNHLIRSTI